MNLNTADVAALDTLPGIGPILAQAIVANRDANGTFCRTSDLARVTGIGPSKIAGFDHLAMARGAFGCDAPPTLVNINTAGAEELDTLPGIGPKTAAAIIADRTLNGLFPTKESITRVKGIGNKTLAKFVDQITIE